MYKRILVAYNGTIESRTALHECINLSRVTKSEVHLLIIVHHPITPGNLWPDFAFPLTDYADSNFGNSLKEHQLKLEEGYQQLETAGITAMKHLEMGEPVEVIERLAKDLDINLVIVGHSKRQSRAFRWWTGTTDAKLTEKIQCSLLIASSI
jgi:nucleotide-binding universal stress UspA family protein